MKQPVQQPVQSLAQQSAQESQQAPQPAQAAQSTQTTTPQQATTQASQTPTEATAAQQTAAEPAQPEGTGEARALPEAQQAELGQKWAERQHAPDEPQPATSPYVNVYNSPDALTVFADMPGCREEDITVQSVDNNIRIIGNRLFEIEGEAQPLQDERSPRIERTIDIPAGVNIENAEASFENGVCEITLPKTEESRPKHIGFQ